MPSQAHQPSLCYWRPPHSLPGNSLSAEVCQSRFPWLLIKKQDFQPWPFYKYHFHSFSSSFPRVLLGIRENSPEVERNKKKKHSHEQMSQGASCGSKSGPAWALRSTQAGRTLWERASWAVTGSLKARQAQHPAWVDAFRLKAFSHIYWYVWNFCIKL